MVLLRNTFRYLTGGTLFAVAAALYGWLSRAFDPWPLGGALQLAFSIGVVHLISTALMGLCLMLCEDVCGPVRERRWLLAGGFAQPAIVMLLGVTLPQELASVWVIAGPIVAAGLVVRSNGASRLSAPRG